MGGDAGTRAPSRRIGSLNGYYRFIHGRSLKLDPFATAGYTGIVSNGSINAFNFGGGMNWWFAHHAGLRLEFRDHITQQSFSFLSSRGSQTIQLPVPGRVAFR